MKVLILRLGALGDVILSTPFMQRIQQHHAGDEVYLLTTPPFAGLFEGWPNLKVVAFPRKGFVQFYKAVSWMRRQRFDVCYDLQSNDRTAWMLRCCSIPRVVASRTFPPSTHHPEKPYRRETHIFDRLNLVMAAGGLEDAEPRPWLPVGEAEQEKVRGWLEGHHLTNKPFVLMHAHASVRWQSKHWPNFGDLAEKIESQGVAVVWIGAGSDAAGNRALASRIGIDSTDTFSINELAELGRHAKFAVTNDSGPMHVLSCSDIPVYAFFGPTNPIQSHAIGQFERVLTHPVACSPCLLPVCPPDKHHRCLDELKVEEVVARLTQDGLLAS